MGQNADGKISCTELGDVMREAGQVPRVLIACVDNIADVTLVQNPSPEELQEMITRVRIMVRFTLGVR